jgi:ATP-dependent Clp protease ATP-binding subunit ClpA
MAMTSLSPPLVELKEEADRQATKVYHREDLTTDCLLMALLRTSESVNQIMASHGVTEEYANAWILRKIGRNVLEPAGSPLVVSTVRQAFDGGVNRARSNSREVSVQDVAIELCLLKRGSVAQMLKELGVNVDALVHELALSNNELPEVDKSCVQLMFHQIGKFLRSSR